MCGVASQFIYVHPLGLFVAESCASWTWPTPCFYFCKYNYWTSRIFLQLVRNLTQGGDHFMPYIVLFWASVCNFIHLLELDFCIIIIIIITNMLLLISTQMNIFISLIPYFTSGKSMWPITILDICNPYMKPTSTSLCAWLMCMLYFECFQIIHVLWRRTSKQSLSRSRFTD